MESLGRNNLVRSVIKKGKHWGNVPLIDIVLGDFEVRVAGLKFLQSIWKAWSQVRHLIYPRYAVGKNPYYYSVKDISIWWGVYLNDKPLAVTQCCSTKIWNIKGISLLQDVIINNQMGSWEEIKRKFNFPNSQKKTYTLVSKALGSLFPGKSFNTHQFLEQVRCQDGKLLGEFSSRQIYKLLNRSLDIIDRINQVWGIDWSCSR